jgi:hypothetical protein
MRMRPKGAIRMSHSQSKAFPFPDDVPSEEYDLASDPGVQALAALVVPGELEEWGDPAASAADDRAIIEELGAMRRTANHISW